ncbi:EXS family-domain-containing protein [Echria macrotheca]|uniref:EXS family-domain-containing protein n=1 Tax=Echria macrotheca TaxID=438768 RepID=A0AAJ0FF55_9PEZI|nr:EXS family-domain-containing protein [Echria macrotheca]
MKFAKELDQDAVPEWRVKYLNYKAGKKHIKAVARAISRANGTPTLSRRGELPPYTGFVGAGRSSTSRSYNGSQAPGGDEVETSRRSPGVIGRTATKTAATQLKDGERSGLANSPGSGHRYGSIGPPESRMSDRYDFALPAPAIKVPSLNAESGSPDPNRPTPPLRSATMAPATRSGFESPATINLPSSGTPRTPRHRLNRIFSTGSALTRQTSSKPDIGLQQLDQVRAAEREFFAFLDSELEKIESFYKQKEDQATERLAALREQLHEMRNRRLAEMAESKKKREQGHSNSSESERSRDGGKDDTGGWIRPIKSRLLLKPGPNSEALRRMHRTPVMTGQPGQPTDERRDYVRKPYNDDVPYRSAKRKLKLALQEFYRGLELLKSYALLNRTAFRKLNKKYDKAVNARPPYRYMNEKVNKSWFVNSDVLDGHISAVEDLYARYFERGNHKIAAGKLRNLNRRPGDSSDSSFRSGLYIGCGAVFGIQGLVYGSELLFSEDLEVVQRTSFLLQLYGGYFLILLLFILFTLDCRMWTKNRINYPFIFEFDTRNNLDWKQLAEFPSFFFALLGVFVWLNFSRLGDWEELYLYYPVILIGLSLIILFFPAPILHHRSRTWLLYSHYRLFFAGFYPVEFRDFFLGDIWCSLTYATCNVELFFCLYANDWNDPTQCNSNHSRLMGFFGALPPLWRALQCIRRYYDTKNVFPHLVNCGKYTMSILTAVFLSCFRIHNSETNMSLFITFAAINAVYCSVWDLFMDFSLLQAHARHPLLRPITALKQTWIYYVIGGIDPILRFSWIFYAIFTHNTQHSTVVSFCVAFAEVARRGMWTLLRVENEHCANVAQYKASRDTPLPYHLHDEESSQDISRIPSVLDDTQASPDSVAISMGTTRTRTQGSVRISTSGEARPSPPGLLQPEDGRNTYGRTRSDTIGKRSILQAMAEAHKQDFEKRKPVEEVRAAELGDEEDDERSGEEDDDDDTGSVEEERMQLREAEGLMKDISEEGEGSS